MADVKVKTIQTRLQLKYDTYANWTDETKEGVGANLVLLKGEIGICAIGDTAETGSAHATTNPTVLFKVGDGVTPFKTLKWASALAADVYAWAKSDTVSFNSNNQKIEFKQGTEVVHDIDLSYFAAASTVSAQADRITDLEAALGLDDGTSENSVSKQIADIVERLGAIQGADTVEGSIAKALKDAKAYTDEREVEIKKYADQAEADAKKDAADNLAAAVETLEAADSALGSRIDAIVGTEGVEGTLVAGDKATLEAAKTYAKEYADGLAGNYDAAGSAADAEANAKEYTDDELAKVVEAQEAIDAAQDEEIDKKLDKTTYEAYIVGKELSDEALKAYADGKASDAQAAAISAAKTETENQIKDLVEKGQVETNRAAIAAMDEAYKAADEALDGRLGTVEAKLADVSNVMDFIGAREVSVVEGAIVVTPVDEETFNKGDVVVDSNGKEYVYDGSVWHEFGYADANASAISGLLTRMTEAEGDIDDLEAGIVTKLDADTFNTWTANHVGENADHAKTATEITAEIAAAVTVEKDRAELAEKAINDTIGTLPTGEGAYTTLVAGIAAAKEQADKGVSDAAAVAGRMTTAEGEIDTLQAASHTHANKDELDLIASGDKAKWDEAYNKRHEHANKAELDLIATGDKAKWDEAATNAAGAVADLAALEPRVKTAEDAIVEITKEGGTIDAAKLAAINAAATDATGKADAALSAAKTYADGLNTAMDTRVGTLESDVAAIQGDYLKASDVYIFNCGSATEVIHTAPDAE